MIVKTQIQRYTEGRVISIEDTLIRETALEIYVGEDLLVTLAATDIQVKELVYGVLFSRGKIKRAEDVKTYARQGNKIRITLVEQEGGALGDEKKKARPPAVDHEKLWEAYKGLFNLSPLLKETGNTHETRLFDENWAELFRGEDMGRGNALEKTIGFCLLNEILTGKTLLLISSRMPLEMIAKIEKIGIMNLACASMATADAVEFAREKGMNFYGMYRGNRYSIYAENRG